MGHLIVSFSRNKIQGKIDFISSLRNKDVLSLVKAFLAYFRLSRGPQACYGILVPLAECGHSEMAVNPFLLGF